MVVVAAGAICEAPSKESGEERVWLVGDLPFLSEVQADWAPPPPPAHLDPRLGLQGEAPFGAWVATTTGAIGAVDTATGGLADRVRTGGVESAMAQTDGLRDGPRPSPADASRCQGLSGADGRGLRVDRGLREGMSAGRAMLRIWRPGM